MKMCLGNKYTLIKPSAHINPLKKTLSETPSTLAKYDNNILKKAVNIKFWTKTAKKLCN